MDPPEQDDELASLMEEVTSDNNGANRGSGGKMVGLGTDAPPSSAFAFGRSPSTRNNSNSSARSQSRQRAAVAASSSSDNDNGSSTDTGNTGTRASRFSGMVSKQSLLLLTLSAIVLLLVMAVSKTESATETDAATSHHGRSKKPASSSSSQHQGNAEYASFHSASPENMYGANRYYKPPGVGYPLLAPQGGLHPIYMNEISSEERTSIEDNIMDGVYYNDDYELSPYADQRLKLTEEERTKEKEGHKKKLNEIREHYGYWDFEDDYPSKNKGKSRPFVDWSTVKKADPILGEIDKGDFPKDAWQTDDEYISKFIIEGKKLVTRVRTAIYDEYGMETIDQQAGVSLAGGKMLGGKVAVAWMYEDSFDALVKKLLNAMITNDHFFVTLGGHSAAAGHGNNFHQSYMMQFQEVMEPVFDRLGMVLVSANRAQGGMGTLQAALAGTGQYGDKDFVLWDSSMTEKDGKAQDLFARQALLSGHRVPVLFDMGGGKGVMDRIHNEAGAHVGGVTGGGLTPKYKNTEFNFGLPEHKYNAKCWTERVDVEVEVQYPGFGGQASWHPGNFVHQSSARKISLVFLHALEEALIRWENATSTDGGEGNPLDGKHWHLQTEEEKIRNALLTVNANQTECGKLFEFIPRVCTVPMRGATEWAPKAYPDRHSLRSLVKPAPDGYVPGILGVQEQAYMGRDPKIPSQRVPEGEVDVAAIARSLPPKTGDTRRMLAERQNHLDNEHHESTANNTLSQYSREVGRRKLDAETKKVVPGEGWSVYNAPAGPYCDGTSNALCHGAKTSHCIMSGHNDARGVMKGDGLSGWIVFQLKDVTQGIFMSRMEAYHEYKSNIKTDGWDEVNNGRIDDERRKGRRRGLKKAPPPLKADWKFEVAVNGVIQYSANSTDYRSHCRYISYNNDICLLWNDEEWAASNKKEDVEFAIRLAGEGGRDAMIGFTHIYYA